MTIFTIRETYGKNSLVSLFHDGIVIYDAKNVPSLELSKLQFVMDSLDKSVVKMGWMKGEKLTVITSADNDMPRWDALLNEMGIIVNHEAKLANLPKRWARALSPRDVIAQTTMSDLKIQYVDDDEFFREKHLDLVDRHHMVLDGPMAIKESYAVKLAKAFHISKKALLRAEGLSMTILTPDGMVKAFAYIVSDKKWAFGDSNVVTGRENLKMELLTVGDLVYVAFDVFQHYADPKSNALMDVALGHIMYTKDAANIINALKANLELALDAIKTGDVAKKLDLWSLPDLDYEMNDTFANQDFAMLSSMAMDWAARGLDIRFSPTLVGMYTLAAERQYWNLSKDWPRYPIVCAWNRPIITESAACMIGEAINVERGEVRAIRNGDVWVVNDRDWMVRLAMDFGGGDGDDHEMLAFRTYLGERGVLIARTPMGAAEFAFLKFHEGDPFPTFTDPMGRVIEFPELPGEIGMSLSEKVEKGYMTVIDLPPADSLAFPSTYGPEFIRIVVSDLIDNSTGYLGQAINRVVLALSVDHNLLNTNYGMETMIDTFTKGGAGVSRTILSDWASELVVRVAESDAVDPIMWEKRSGNPDDIFPKALVPGLWSHMYHSNVAVRKNFSKRAHEWHYQWLVQNPDLLTATAKLFGLSPYGVQNDKTNPVLKVAAEILASTKNEQYHMNVAARAENRYLSAEEWRSLYEFTRSNILAASGGDDACAELLTVAVWLVAMTAKSNPNDKIVMNSVNYETFMRGLVRFGIAADTQSLFSYLKWDKEMDIESDIDEAVETTKSTEWDMTCPACSNTYHTQDVRSYVRYVFSDDKKCVYCRQAS